MQTRQALDNKSVHTITYPHTHARSESKTKVWLKHAQSSRSLAAWSSALDWWCMHWNVTIYYYILLYTTIYYYILLYTTIYYYILLYTTIYYYILLYTTINYHTTRNYYATTIYYYILLNTVFTANSGLLLNNWHTFQHRAPNHSINLKFPNREGLLLEPFQGQESQKKLCLQKQCLRAVTVAALSLNAMIFQNIL